MTPLLLIAGLSVALVALGVAEYALHRRNLHRIGVRIHINGTRGKSSVTRLVAAGLRAGGLRTCAKTTGTLARFIDAEGREFPVFRPASPNVIEQVRIVAAAVAQKADVLVMECMALQPHLQWLSEARLIRATHGVVTNARPDHLDVMGPSEQDVAWALAGMTPPGRCLYTAEADLLGPLLAVAEDRATELIAVGGEDIAAVTDEELGGFSYFEHAENVALALRICGDQGVERSVAIRGMWRAQPDPGVLRNYELDWFGRSIVFVNAFAANDPQSTERIWRMTIDRNPDATRRIAVFNLRSDRPERSISLGDAAGRWPRADVYVLVGSGTYLFARSAAAAGIQAGALAFAEEQEVHEIFETILAECTGGRTLVVGMGNIGGVGFDLVSLFRNRARLAEGGHP